MEIREAVALLKKSLSGLSQLVFKMRDKGLWKMLVNPCTGENFKSWEAYAKASSPFGHTKLFELAGIGSLAHGPFALPQETIDAMGYNRAKEIAKLPPEERKQLAESAVKSDPIQFSVDLCNAKNKHLPPEEQKEATVLFARNYPVSLVARFKDLEARALYMEQFHDADKSISAEAKFLYALVIFFEAGNAEELQQADKRRKAAEKKKLSA
jgi:hypothetical protein